MRPHSKLATGLALSAALVPTGIAHAAIPNIDVWSGQTKHKSNVTLYKDHKQAKVSIQFSPKCTSADPSAAVYEFDGMAKPKNGKVKLTVKDTTGKGTMHLSAKVKAGNASTGKVSWKLPASANCSGKDSFKLKYVLSHGG